MLLRLKFKLLKTIFLIYIKTYPFQYTWSFHPRAPWRQTRVDSHTVRPVRLVSFREARLRKDFSTFFVNLL